MKNFFKTFLIIILAAAAFVLGFLVSKADMSKWKPSPLVEAIPYGEVIEMTSFAEAEFYDSKNEFMGAEIQVNIKYPARLEPASKLPAEYKEGMKKLYSSCVLHVKEIPSKEVLEKMKQALSESRHLKLVEGEGVRVSYVEDKIEGRKAKRIVKIELKPENYYFVKY